MTSLERIASSHFPGEIDAAAGDTIAEFWAEDRADQIRSLLLEYGAVLLRSFDVGDVEAFRNFVCAFSGKPFFDYAGGASPRHRTTASGVYNSTDYPPDLSIPLHNELSYSNVYPQHLYFMCVTPADDGGQTTLGDGRRILAAIDDAILNELRQKGVCYIRNLTAEPASGYSWVEAFGSNDRDVVERIIGLQGAEFRWLSDDTLQLRQVRPATTRHPVTGEEVWFNQVYGFYFDRSEFGCDVQPRLECTFGDGTEIPIEIISHIRRVLEEQTFDHNWEMNDVVFLDNVLALHGRKPYTGEREIVLAMT